MTARSGSRPLLELESITLAFGGQVVLSELHLALDSGEVLGLIGPNGSGKTSVCNVVSGIYRPQAGTVHVDGTSILGREPHEIARLGVSRTFQGAEVLPGLSVIENTLVGRERHWRGGLMSVLARTRAGRSETREQLRTCSEALELVGLEWAADLPAEDLPFGQRKLIELARCLAMQPRILLLDEPTSGMRPDEKAEVGEVVRRVQEAREVGILLIEHDIELVRDLTSRTAVLDFGVKIADGPTDDVFRNASVRSVYIGDVADASGSATTPLG